MEHYGHGIETTRDASVSNEVVQATRVQVAIGTAPVNLLDNPSRAVNKPIYVKNRGEVSAELGVSTDYDHYTLMQTMLASMVKMGVGPIVMINVLDPTNPAHITAVAGKEFAVESGSVTIKEEGILLDKLVVSAGSETGTADDDYVAAFNSDGYVTIAVKPEGKFKGKDKITIAYTKINADGVKPEDIIGGMNEAGKRTGIALVDEVYARFGVVPDIITAPKYSQDPAVAAALEAKAELIADLINAMAVIDIESSTTQRLEQVKAAKDKLGCCSRWTTLCWPKVLMNGQAIYASAAVAAVMQYIAMNNGNIPKSPDNKSVPIDGVVLEDGTEVYFTQSQVNDYLNAIGVLSFLYLEGWKCWGSNTAAYPDNTEPNNRFIKCVMISSYLETRFKVEYLPEVGEDGSYADIESIVSNYNADLNALVPDYLAGAEVIFDKSENPISQIIAGKYIFRTKYADPTPKELIVNKFTWDSSILKKSFEGGE